MHFTQRDISKLPALFELFDRFICNCSDLSDWYSLVADSGCAWSREFTYVLLTFFRKMYIYDPDWLFGHDKTQRICYLAKFFLLYKKYNVYVDNLLQYTQQSTNYKAIGVDSIIRRKRLYTCINNIKLIEVGAHTRAQRGATFTNCELFYKFIHADCPIMIYLIKKRNLLQYKHGRKDISRYVFDLRILNPYERMYYSSRYVRYTYLFNKNRTIGLRLFSYLFGILVWPKRLVIHSMGVRAVAKSYIVKCKNS